MHKPKKDKLQKFESSNQKYSFCGKFSKGFKEGKKPTIQEGKTGGARKRKLKKTKKRKTKNIRK